MQWLKTRGQRDRHVIALMDGRSKRSAFDDRHRRSVEGRLALQSFVINSHGRMVFPSNFIPDLDFTVIDSLDQLEEVVRRDVEAKAPSGTEILRRIEAGDHYRTRFELMRDVALNLFWTDRFAMTMYDKRPVRWGDVPRNRDDVFLPALTPWQDAQRKVDAVQACFAALTAAWDAQVEDKIFGVLFAVLRHRRFHATDLAAVQPTVAQLLADPGQQTYSLASYDPNYPVYGYQQILDCAEDAPELEALHRWAMVLHNQYPWDRTRTVHPISAVRPAKPIKLIKEPASSPPPRGPPQAPE
jgi:3-oxoacyl-[acyl-carrier-protein] synthase-3